MKTITLYRANGSWIARFSDPRVIRLMGTADIPTPFYDTASAGLVAQEIGKRNPGVTIITGEVVEDDLERARR